jgi:hypothetical protein
MIAAHDTLPESCAPTQHTHTYKQLSAGITGKHGAKPCETLGLTHHPVTHAGPLANLESCSGDVEVQVVVRIGGAVVNRTIVVGHDITVPIVP